jgi:hypothetical protein
MCKGLKIWGEGSGEGEGELTILHKKIYKKNFNKN